MFGTTQSPPAKSRRVALRAGTPAGGHRRATGAWRRGCEAVPLSHSAAAGRLCEETTFSGERMSAAEFSRFDDLVSRYLDDQLMAADAAELLALLAEPALAARFLETSRLNSEIAGLLAAPVPDAAMVELVRADIEKSLASADSPAGARLRIGERTRPIVATPPTVVPLHPMAPRRKPALRALAWAAVFLVF